MLVQVGNTVGKLLGSGIYKAMSESKREELRGRARQEVVAELLAFKNPSDEIGWRIYDYLEEFGMMPDGNILLNDEVDEISYMVRDYIQEKIKK